MLIKNSTEAIFNLTSDLEQQNMTDFVLELNNSTRAYSVIMKGSFAIVQLDDEFVVYNNFKDKA